MQIGSLNLSGARELPQLAGLGKAGAANPAETLAGAGAVGEAGKGGFSNLLARAVAEVDGRMQVADAEKTKVLTGESTNMHQAVIAMQEASVAFSLMVEVRNKLVESYQELMRMQV